jgi:hypothetical protein
MPAGCGLKFLLSAPALAKASLEASIVAAPPCLALKLPLVLPVVVASGVSKVDWPGLTGLIV